MWVEAVVVFLDFLSPLGSSAVEVESRVVAYGYCIGSQCKMSLPPVGGLREDGVLWVSSL